MDDAPADIVTVLRASIPMTPTQARTSGSHVMLLKAQGRLICDLDVPHHAITA